MNETSNDYFLEKVKFYISSNFGDSQLLDLLNFQCGATSLESSVKEYKIPGAKQIFSKEWFDNPNEMQDAEKPLYDAFLVSCVAVVLLKRNAFMSIWRQVE